MLRKSQCKPGLKVLPKGVQSDRVRRLLVHEINDMLGQLRYPDKWVVKTFIDLAQAPKPQPDVIFGVFLRHLRLDIGHHRWILVVAVSFDRKVENDKSLNVTLDTPYGEKTVEAQPFRSRQFLQMQASKLALLF